MDFSSLRKVARIGLLFEWLFEETTTEVIFRKSEYKHFKGTHIHSLRMNRMNEYEFLTNIIN